MNKKLLALAIAGAFVAPAAMADSSNVTIYGTLSMSVENVDGGSCSTGAGGNCITNPTATVDNGDNRGRVSSNTSYFGFRVKEDLGNGLDAHAQLETALNIDTGGGIGWGGTIGNRNNFVGLGSKSWGSLDFGLIDSPLKTSTGKLDLFGGGHTIADYRSLFATRDSSVRQTNSVMYTSPNFNGFSAKGQYGFGDGTVANETGSTKSPSFWSLGATYENGPIFVTGAYEDNTKATNSGSVFDNGGGVTGVGGYNVTTAAAAETEFKTWRVGGGYNFGVAKIGAAYQSMKMDISTDGTTSLVPALGTTVTTAAGAGTSAKRDSWHISGEYNVTKAIALGAQYTKANDWKDLPGGLNGSDTAADQWTIGGKYAMSKRTTAYALYTQVNNKDSAAYALGGGATGTDVVNAAAFGEDPRAFSVGMIHKF
jgi:predicted porin